MNNLYINTYLFTNVGLHPSQMNNNIRKNIKNNLIEKVNEKCILDYGYIVEIHDITYISDAVIIPEDPLASAIFNVKFLCTLCNPLINSIIIGQIDNITSKLIKISNGPIEILVVDHNIKTTNFRFDNKSNEWIANTYDNNKIILKPKIYVNVKILSKSVIDKSTRILCMGYLDNLASEEEINNISKNDSKHFKMFENINEYIEYTKNDNITKIKIDDNIIKRNSDDNI